VVSEVETAPALSIHAVLVTRNITRKNALETVEKNIPCEFLTGLLQISRHQAKKTQQYISFSQVNGVCF
jgi:hypothetical protein